MTDLPNITAGLALLTLLVGCGEQGFTDPSRAVAPAVTASDYPVTIHQPETLGVLDTPPAGAGDRATCSSCHGPGDDEAALDGDDIHADVTLEHGTLSCDSCHRVGDRSLLHLADDTPLEPEQAMVLCSQCHGIQRRDYDRGSHGGMRDYWDLKRGPRERSSCLDCHDVHAPAFGQLMPEPPPADRFFGTAHKDADE